MPSPFAADKFGSMVKRLDQSKAAAAARKVSHDFDKDTQEVPKQAEKPQEPPTTANKFRQRMEMEWKELKRSICAASPAKSPSGFITKAHEHDVILEEGSSNHAGNVYYRSLVQKYKDEYDRCPRAQNYMIPSRIVAIVRDQKPPGRFLRHFSQNPTASPKVWYDVGTEEALDCTRQALKDCTKEDPPASLTPSKRTSDESPGPARTIADLASRTHRKVFSTGFFASKKLKRFQNDSPSKLSRSSSNVSVVDLCSSDDEEGKSDEGKPPASPKAFSPESKGGTSWTFGSPTKVGSRAFGSNPSPRKEPNNSSSIASNTASSEEIQMTPNQGVNFPVTPGCCAMDPVGKMYPRFDNEPEGTLPLADEAEDKKSKEIPTITTPSVDSPFRPSEGRISPCLRFDGDTARTVCFADEAAEKKFVLDNFSIERQRLLLDVLAPITLSPEAMKTEKWTSNDVEPSVVSKAFSQRFGSLTTAELDRLANGDFLVPEGMVSVKDTLRAYRLSLKDMAKPSIEKETIEGTSSKTAESTANEVSNNSFAWDGTIELVPKDRSTENLSIIDSNTPAPTAEKNLPKNDSETKAVALQDEEKANNDPSVDVESSKECESIAKDPPCEEYENEGRTGNERWDSLSNYVSSLFEANSPTNEGDLETSEPEEGNEHEGTVTSEKEAEDSLKNTIVEYRGNDQPIENGEGQSPDFRETRVALSDVMTNIIDMVSSRFRQEQESFPEEIEVKNLIEDKENDEHSSEASHDDKEEKVEDEKDRPLIVVSAKQLLLLALPLICLAGIFRRLGLFDVSNSILEGCFRTFVQLHILGSLLSPIFKYGAKRPLLVGCYALFMIVLASYEASSRTKYTHEGQFAIIVQSLVLNVGWVAMWAFGAILKPRPVWNPRYLLPIVGMLLGNSINGISITLDTITSSLVEKQSEVDLYLSFGADQYEAVSGIVAHAIQKGTTPSLNMMCVVGIVSIPGMMTGQILGGSSPMVAARYQAMIIFLIALSTLSTILVSSCLTVMSAFCSHQILRPDRFVKNRKRGLARLILWAWGYVFGGGKDVIPVGSNTGSGGLLADEGMNKAIYSTTKGFEIRSLKRGSVVLDGEGFNSLIQVSGLNRYFSVEDQDDQCSETDNRRTLFSDLSFLVNEGDLLLVSGPSGTGKSQLLRMMAGLSPLQEGDLWLQGKSWKDEYNGNLVVEWRRQVRYVTQTKVQIPGTPLQFIRKIQSFQSWKTNEERIEYDFMKHVSHHLRQWGMGLDSLNKDWAVLSGGESQRVLMAIALASRPKILLFDESTSALDHESKLAVETSIKDFVADHEGGVMWVSHDEQQAERMQSQ